MRSFLSCSSAKAATVFRGLERAVAAIGAAGLNLLFPPRCVACGAEFPDSHAGSPLCDECFRSLAPATGVGCYRCGAIGIPEDSSAEGCLLCRGTRLHFDTVVPLGLYRGPLRSMVLRMKMPAGESLAAAMGRVLARHRHRQLADLQAEFIAPVPMHWTRRFRRGTNSPEILARSLGRELRLPVRHLLLWRRNTLKQSNLAPKARFSNVRGAFGLRARRSLSGCRILLVDDVLTTGATCSEAAGILKKAGATAVAVAVLARGQGRDPM